MINAPSGDPNNLEIGRLVCFFGVMDICGVIF